MIFNYVFLFSVVRLREFSSARQDKFMVKITDMNENSLGTKIVVADLRWGGSTDVGDSSKKAQKVLPLFNYANTSLASAEHALFLSWVSSWIFISRVRKSGGQR